MINYNTLPDYAARKVIINELCKCFKSIRHYFVGESICKREIDVLQIGNTKNTVLFCGGFHGMEYLTVLALLKYAEECALALKNEDEPLSNALKIRGVTIVPCVNPDGVEIAINGSCAALNFKELVEKVCTNTKYWQANAAGVDINHNFDAGWCELRKKEIELGINGPSPTRFGGKTPHSEPETKALVKLCGSINFERAIAFHSQGREIYFSYGEHTPRLCSVLAQRFADVSGYKAAQPEDIATGGGFKDWVIDKLHKPALTVEIGLGKNPLPLSDFENEYKIVRKILTEATLL